MGKLFEGTYPLKYKDPDIGFSFNARGVTLLTEAVNELQKSGLSAAVPLLLVRFRDRSQRKWNEYRNGHHDSGVACSPRDCKGSPDERLSAWL